MTLAALIGILTPIIAALAPVIGRWALLRINAQQDPAVQAAVRAQQEVDAVNKTEKAVAKEDIQEIRNELAE